MFKKYVVVGPGFWGKGDDIKTAHDNYMKAGGRAIHNQKPIAYEATSKVPFSPNGRKPKKNEANVYVDGSGYVTTLNCTVKLIGKVTRKGTLIANKKLQAS